MTEKAKIRFVNYGVAHVINEEIFLNKKLQEKPELMYRILEHEIKHINGENPDWFENFDADYVMFILQHPSSWIHLLPVYFKQGVIVYDKMRVLFWALAIIWVLTLWNIANHSWM